MKKIIFWVLIILAGIAVVSSALRTGDHEFTEQQCPDCHSYTPVKGDPHAKIMKAPISELCGRCHKRPENMLSHPVEIKPEAASLPADLPLSWDGKMTCSTCHDIHATPSPSLDGSWLSLRRESTGRVFCEACHRDGVAKTESVSGHARTLTTAHMEFDGKQKGQIDTVSEFCMECHDSSIAQDASVKFESSSHGAGAMGSAQDSHPVGIKYRTAMAKNGGLRPRESLDPKIKLVSGRISCISCHDLYSREPMKLTMTTAGAALCLNCHDK